MQYWRAMHGAFKSGNLTDFDDFTEAVKSHNPCVLDSAKKPGLFGALTVRLSPVTLADMQAAFDTLSAARRMEEAGMDRAQAEALAETAREAASASRDDLATKSDLAALEARLTWRIFVVVAGANGLLFAALRLLS